MYRINIHRAVEAECSKDVFNDFYHVVGNEHRNPGITRVVL